MKVINIHKRVIQKNKHTVGEILTSLSNWNDIIWPKEQWPRIKLSNDFNVGSKGGHGMISYYIIENIPGTRVEFKFTYPKGFDGTHWIGIKKLDKDTSEISHTIKMKTNWKDTFTWIFVVRPLHDALIEDAFDKLENNLDGQHKSTKWSPWVRFCRYMLKTKSK